MSERVLDFGVDFVWKVRDSVVPELDADGFDLRPPDVIVVGAGPVGLTIAAGLVSSGVRVLVLEASTTVCQSSRANGVVERTFETLDRVFPGLGTELSARSARTQGSVSYYGERVILQQTAKRATDMGGKFEPASYLSQWWIEEGLVEALNKRPGLAEIRWASTVTTVRQSAGIVEVEVETPLGGYSVRAPWLVAADGGRSTVRRQLGKRMTGVTYGPAFIVVDAKVGGTLPRSERAVWFDPPYLPGGLLLRHIPPDGFWRLDFQFPIGTDVSRYDNREAITELIRAHLADIGHDSDEVEPYWFNVYEPRALSLDSYRDSHILFAGDAAHLLPFFGGFGMNAGIDDADNLSWKLALVASGRSDPSLLDTYSEERVPSVLASADFVTLSAEFLTPTSAESESLRRAALTLAAQGDLLTAGLGRHRLSRPMLFPESRIRLADDPAFSAGPPPGALIPRGWLELGGERCYIHDAIPAGFSWLVFSGDTVDSIFAQELSELSQGLPVPIPVLLVDDDTAHADLRSVRRATDPTGEVRDAFAASAGGVYLIRPDRIVAGRWRIPPAWGPLLDLAVSTMVLGEVE